MKQSKRILAYSALALVVMLAAFGAIAFDTSNVAYAQGEGPVPAAPTLTAEATGADTINLSWNEVDDAVSYDLWAWNSVNEWQQLGGGTLTGTSFSHSPLTSGTTYYYQIRAFNSDGDPSGWSDRVNEVAGDMVPDAPALTTTPGYQQIMVEWPPVTDATRYELWAWLGSWTQVDGGALTATSYVHGGLTTGRTYYFQGRAVNSAGVMSAWSALVSTTVLSTPNITAPTSFSAARGDEQVTLTWTAATAPAGQTIASYEYQHVASGGTFADSWTNVGNVTTATVTGLTNGTTYDFEVRAVSNTDATGNAGSASATPATVPGAPDADRHWLTTSASPLTGLRPPTTAAPPSPPTASSGRKTAWVGSRKNQSSRQRLYVLDRHRTEQRHRVHLPHLRHKRSRRQRLDLSHGPHLGTPAHVADRACGVGHCGGGS